MFGREPHSREGYEDLKNKTDLAKQAAKENPGSNWSIGEARQHEQHDGSFETRNEDKYIPSEQEEAYSKMQKKLEKMKNQGHAEALQIEAKNRTLNDKFREALVALKTFETEELGMHQESFQRSEEAKEFKQDNEPATSGPMQRVKDFLKTLEHSEANSLEARHHELLEQYNDALDELVAFQQEQLDIE